MEASPVTLGTPDLFGRMGVASVSSPCVRLPKLSRAALEGRPRGRGEPSSMITSKSSQFRYVFLVLAHDRMAETTRHWKR